nr:serine carboxypeptidase-like 18 [Quercus suber]
MELTGRRMTWICSYVLLQILFFSSYATSRSIVKTLPGFDGDLPFKLETGYVGAGEMDDVQLFYYFVESQREPSRDPLLVWLTGGPGCSSFKPFFYGNGPLSFDYIFSERGLPTLHLNKDTWTKRLNILYIDAPVGSGFSYSKSLESYYSVDQKTVAHLYNFLQKWLIDHPEFAENHLYLGGGSYTGILIPVTVQKIYDGIRACEDSYLDTNSKVPAAHRLTLISDELYKSAKTSCKGDYVNIDPTNERCMANVEAIDEGNNPGVREALYVREGTKGYWHMCNSSLAYTKNILSTIDYHRNLSRTNLRVLIYCADLDMSIPHIGTQEMIRSLNLTLDDSWCAWFVDAQVAGYTQRYKNNDFYMTCSSVKGAGHVAEEYKPKEVNAMIDRWLAYYPL